MDIHNCQKLIVFGGSFDPPHRAHLELPFEVCRKVGGDMVVFVPAGNAPHKQGQQQTAGKHRLAMLNLALGKRPGCMVLAYEIEKAADGKPNYTVDTLVSLREQASPDAKMRLLIGGDMLRIFDTWRDANRIVELAEPLVMVRPPDDSESLLKHLPAGYDAKIWRRRLVEVAAMDISSSMIRERVKKNLDISGLVDLQVERYIREHGLYMNN